MSTICMFSVLDLNAILDNFSLTGVRSTSITIMCRTQRRVICIPCILLTVVFPCFVSECAFSRKTYVCLMIQTIGSLTNVSRLANTV